MGSKAIRQPLKKGVAKVPVIMQLEALECGAASLAMLMAYYGKWVPLEQVRVDCGVSRDGSKAKNIALAAMHYGFKVRAFRFDPQTIQKEASFPCIIHWNMNHFVVPDGFKRNHAYLNDPARGNIAVSRAVSNQRINITRTQMRDQAKLASTLTQSTVPWAITSLPGGAARSRDLHAANRVENYSTSASDC